MVDDWPRKSGRDLVARAGILIWSLLWSGICVAQSTTRHDVIVVVGAAGADEYATEFSQWTEQWRSVLDDADASLTVIGEQDGDANDELDRERLFAQLQQADRTGAAPLWLVLIGHGTFANDVAKFNLRGPDVSATELAEQLEGFNRTVVVINCASSSGPFINRISAPNRVILTATKSGTEMNFARFGKFLATAIGASDADLDHDDEVSVLEAFLRASADVQSFYQVASRLSTEHALLDDNGDGLGTPATLYQGIRPESQTKSGKAVDGQLARKITFSPDTVRLPFTAEELTERAEIERELEELRAQRAAQDEEEYFLSLQSLMLAQARLYRAAEQRRDADRENASTTGDGE